MDPRLTRTSSNTSDTSKSTSPSRGDPRLRAQQEQQQQQQQQQHHWPHPMAQMPQTHYTIGDGLTTYQHLVPNTTSAAPAIYPTPYAQYPGYATYQTSAYGHHPAYAAYYTPAPPPQHIDQNYQQQPPQMPPTPAQATQAAVPQTYAPLGAPQGSWAPARMSEQVAVQVQAPITAYMQQQQQAATLPPSPDITSTSKQEGVEQEMQQSQAEMRRQRDDFEVRAAALSRELDQLKRQKRELKQQLSDNSADRQTAVILKDNAKLQTEIQTKVKEFTSMADILSGILGERKKSGKERGGSKRRHRSRERSSSEQRASRSRADRSPRDKSAGAASGASTGSRSSTPHSPSDAGGQLRRELPDLSAAVHCNYVHYDPEVHWCRICDAFPRTAKDLLQHLHDDDHRHLMQAENIEIPWHKLPSQDKEFPFREGALKRRVPIKGLQFFVSAPAWYCRLCDVWIGDLHCASQHLKSVGHSQNYTNFVDQNPQWENDWLEDRKKALERVSKNLMKEGKVNSVLDLAGIERKAKTLASMSSVHLEGKKKRKKSSKKKSKKNKSTAKKSSKGKKYDSDSSSCTTSSSEDDDDDDDDSSSDDDDDDDVDKTKSIRVAMRNQTTKPSSAVVDEIKILENLVKEKKRLQKKAFDTQMDLQSKPSASNDAAASASASASAATTKAPSTTDDRLIAQWMNIDSAGSGDPLSTSAVEKNKDKYLLDSLKDRLKQKQDREERARQVQQLQQQQKELDEQRAAEEVERAGHRREEEQERREREAEVGIMSSSREQVKFRQLRGGKAATVPRHRSSTDAPSPTAAAAAAAAAAAQTSPRTASRPYRRASRSRSSSAERHNHAHSRDHRDTGRRDHHRGSGGYSNQRYRAARGDARRHSRSRSRSTSKSRTNGGGSSSSSSKAKPTEAVVTRAIEKKQPQAPTQGVQKKLPFIGRMPLFKNRKFVEDQGAHKTGAVVGGKATTEVSGAGDATAAGALQDPYEMPRQSRFQPGNLARAFIPQPDVVHYPKLTTQPAPATLPEAPRISVPRPPPPPKIQAAVVEPQVYEYTEAEFAPSSSAASGQLEHLMLPPLPPPPPPRMSPLHFSLGGDSEDVDDLAMLGISSDDMAAQVF